MIEAMLAITMSQVSKPYSEPQRPQFHFTALKGWINDPNGLSFFNGEYHLFFQHNPFGTAWGNMTWGHAVSRDLVHWRQLSEAIKPDELGTVFSGSGVVDMDDTAGFGKGALICMYTAAGGTNDASKGKPFTQCLAYSTDGRTFTKFPGNPVLPHLEAENRDPKLVWYGPAKKWVLALYLDGDRYGLFSSPDLKRWRRVSQVELPRASECPDFFALPLDGDAGRIRWVFWGASGYYQVGSFDGRTFRPETESIRSDYGNTGYASQTFFNDPKGRRVQIAWFNNSEFPGCSWNQQLGFPNELRLRSTPAGPRLTFEPVSEIESLRRLRLQPMRGRFLSQTGLLDVDVLAPANKDLDFVVNGERIRYKAQGRVLNVAGKEAVMPLDEESLDLRILADRASIEIYAQGGLVYMPIFRRPTQTDLGLHFAGVDDRPRARVRAYELESAF